MTNEERHAAVQALVARLKTPESQASLEKAAAATRQRLRELEEANRLPPDFWFRRVTI